MKYFHFLQKFYPLYLNIIFKYPNKVAFQAFTAIFAYLHFTFLIADIHLPSVLMNVALKGPVVHHIQCILYFLPWIFTTTHYLFDGTIFFIVNVFSFIVLFHARDLSLERKYVPHWECSFIKFYQSVYVHVACYPLFFRICLLSENVGSYHNVYAWTSFALCLLNLVCIFIHLYFSSIFLSSFGFISKSVFDTYDGKSNMILYIMRFIFCAVTHLISMSSDIILISLFAILLFAIAVFLFYYRVVLSVHVYSLADYLEIAPLVGVPILIFIQAFTKNIIIIAFSIIAVHVITIISIYISKKMILKESFYLFGAFMKANDETAENSTLPHVIPGNIISVLRTIATNLGDPMVFEKILILQHRFGVKASPMIEIARFLGVFPSRRKAMIKELTGLKSASNYNRFTIYFFLKFLRSLVNSSDERHTKALDMLQRGFLVHHHLYWSSRSHNTQLETFKESCATSYYFIELQGELLSLIERYPFDNYLYTRYADFSLIGCGDYTSYKKSLQIASDLERNRNFITDPLLHKMVKINARVLQYCSEDEISASMPTKTTTTASNLNENPIASFLSISNKFIPFIPIIHTVLVAICFLAYFIACIPYETDVRNQYHDYILSRGPTFQQYFYQACSSTFFSFALESSTDNNFTSITDYQQCRITYDELFYQINDYFTLIPQVDYLTNSVFKFVGFYSNLIINNNSSICESLYRIPEIFTKLPENNMNHLTLEINYIVNSLNRLYDSVSEKYLNTPFYAYYLIIGFAVSIIYIFTLFIQVNHYYRKNKEIIEFLSSNERITALLLERSVESWELLRKHLPKQISYHESIAPRIHPVNNQHHHNSCSSSVYTSISNTNNQFGSKTGTESKNNPSIFKNINETLGSEDSSTTSLKRLKLDQARISVSFTGAATAMFMNKINILKDYGIDNVKTSRSAPQSDDDGTDIENKENTTTIQSDNPEDIPIELTISTTKKENKYSWILIPFQIILPWIILMVSCLLLLIPIKTHLDLEEELTISIMENGFKLNTTIALIRATYNILNGEYNPDLFSSFQDVLLTGSSNITEIYTREQCFQLVNITCTSISELVFYLAFHLPTNEEIQLLYLPAFIDFCNNIINDIFFNENDPFLEVPTSSIIAFFIDFLIVFLIALYYSILNHHDLVMSFNSLYHFPTIFIDSIHDFASAKSKSDKKHSKKSPKKDHTLHYSSNKSKNNKSQIMEKLPSSIISVASVKSTDEIYSISENVVMILNRPSPTFIGEKFNEIFPKIKDVNIELREHLMPDRVKKKVFRSQTVERGDFLITLMIEDQMIGVAKPAYMQESMQEKLMNFIPTFYAKSYCDSNQTTYIYEDPIIIILRYDITKSQNEIERFYTTLNALIMNYKSFKIIKADGGIFTFCTIKKINPFIAFLFARDIITEAFSVARTKPTKAPLSLYIEELNSIKLSLNSDFEPFLETDIANFDQYETLVYHLEMETIAFNENFISYLHSDNLEMLNYYEEFNNQCKVTQVEYASICKTIKQLGFSQYIELIKKFV